MNYFVFILSIIGILLLGLIILSILYGLSQKIKNKRFSKFVKKIEEFLDNIDPMQVG